MNSFVTALVVVLGVAVGSAAAVPNAWIVSLYGTPSTYRGAHELSGLKEVFDHHAIVAAFKNPKNNEIKAVVVPKGIRGIFDQSNVDLHELREFMYSDVPKAALTLNSARYLNIPEMYMPMRMLQLPADKLDTRLFSNTELQHYPVILFINKDSALTGDDFLGELTRLGDFSYDKENVKIVNDFTIPLNEREEKYLNPTFVDKDLVTKYVTPTYGKKDLIRKYADPTFGERDLITKHYINPIFAEKDLIRKYVNPIHGEKDILTTYISPIHGEKDLMTEYIHPIHGDKYLIRKSINPIYGEKDLMTKYISPIYGEKDLVTEYITPIHGEKHLIRKSINPIHGERDLVGEYINPIYGERDLIRKSINPIYGEKDLLSKYADPIYSEEDLVREFW